MPIQIIDQLKDLKGKRIFIRTDFNVPLDEARRITDDLRIRAALPTIKYAMEKQARVIIASHLGRPKGKKADDFSLKPVAVRLGELLSCEVKFAPDCVGEEVERMVADLAPGEVLLLENLRFHKAETDNDPVFSEQLGRLCDVYVDDAFACAHRAHASIEGITHFVDEVAAGFLMKEELDAFQKSMKDPSRPLVAIIGGAKVSTKLGVLENMISKVDKLIIGGAMAYTFLKAAGKQVGKSKVEDDMLDQAKKISSLAAEKGVELLLPEDVMAATDLEAGVPVQLVPAGEIPADLMGLDIGPKTIEKFEKALKNAKTVVWNGPLGVFEIEDFSRGTMSMAQFLGKSDATVIAGGGDTDSAIQRANVEENIDHISTGGGAFLEMMEGKVLPGFKALDK